MIRGQAKEQLLESARWLYARNGVGATSIRSVISRAGANLNAVHSHFGSRETLVDAVAERAMQTLNSERFARFDDLEERRGEDASSVTARQIIDAGYGPLFDQALGPDRHRTRDGLLVIGQLRNDPLGASLEVMNSHSTRFVERVEALLRTSVSRSPTKLRSGMQLVNAAAWDCALRPDVLVRIKQARSQPAALRRFTRDFFDFAVAGLLAVTSREPSP